MAWFLRELAIFLEDYVPTWLLTNVCNSILGDLMPFLASAGTAFTWYLDTYQVLTHLKQKKKINKR